MLKTLIVEDNRMFSQLLSSLLTGCSPDLSCGCCTGEEPLADLMSRWSPDLIVVDVSLPGTNGLQLTRQVKRLHPLTVVIVITNHEQAEYREAAVEAGADYFFRKDEMTEDALKLAIASVRYPRPSAGRNSASDRAKPSVEVAGNPYALPYATFSPTPRIALTTPTKLRHF